MFLNFFFRKDSNHVEVHILSAKWAYRSRSHRAKWVSTWSWWIFHYQWFWEGMGSVFRCIQLYGDVFSVVPGIAVVSHDSWQHSSLFCFCLTWIRICIFFDQWFAVDVRFCTCHISHLNCQVCIDILVSDLWTMYYLNGGAWGGIVVKALRY